MLMTNDKPGEKSAGADVRRIHVLEIVGNAIMGGMETHLRNLIRLMPREQFRFTCIAPFESPFTVMLRELGCEVLITPVEDDPAWRSIQMTVEVTRQYDVDVIHAHMPRAHSLAALAACFTHRPIVATVHGMNVTTQEYGIWRLAGSHLITVCQEAFSQALAMGVPLDHVTLIPNGVDTQLFTPGRSGAAFRESLGIPPHAPLIGLVGRLDWEKTPNRFVEMAGLIRRRRPDAHFVLVGDGVMRNDLIALIRTTGLEECVHLAGIRENIWDVYPALDILVNTSRSEGMPLTLLEGMACGLPVVAGRVGGIREIVEEGGSGLLVGEGDIASAADRVLLLLDHPEWRKRMGDRGRERVLQYFNNQTNAALTANLLQRLAQPDPQRRPIWSTRLVDAKTP